MQLFPQNARVVFLGDRITAANGFIARIAAYYRTVRPQRRLVVHNSGVSGGTIASVLQYYEPDAAPFCPTHAVVMLGVNDARIELLSQPDSPERHTQLDEAYSTYCQGMQEICDILAAKDVAVTLCTPVPYAEFSTDKCTSLPSGDRTPLPRGYRCLLQYADFIRKQAKKRRLPLVDFHAYMQERYPLEPLYKGDHIHPNDAGQARMAECFLETQGEDIRPFLMGEEVPPLSGDFAEWHTAVTKIRQIFAME